MAKKKTKLEQKFEKYRGRKPGNNKQESNWDLYRDGVTISLIKKFLGCRERTRLSVVEGWRPKGFKFPLEFGNVFHIMEELNMCGYSLDECFDGARNYVQRKLEGLPLGASDINDLLLLQDIAITTFRRYLQYWEEVTPTFVHEDLGEAYEGNIEWGKPEQTFDVPVELCNGKIIRFRGRKDGAFTHPFTGLSGVKETKTKGRVFADAIELALLKDIQTGGYLYAHKLERQEYPAHCVYNLIRRTQLEPRKGRGKAKKGRESNEQFCQRLDEDIANRMDFYFMRWIVDVTPQDVDAFFTQTFEPILIQMCDWWDSIKDNPFDPWKLREKKLSKKNAEGHHTRNPLHFVRPYGSVDESVWGSGLGSFPEIIFKNDYSQYQQIDVPFSELED